MSAVKIDFRPVVVRGVPDAHAVWLVIGEAEFPVGPAYFDKKSWAEVYGASLQAALASIGGAQ